MSEVGASSLVDPISTKKKNKVLNFAKLEHYKKYSIFVISSTALLF